jgi:hypothetical protein
MSVARPLAGRGEADLGTTVLSPVIGSRFCRAAVPPVEGATCQKQSLGFARNFAGPQGQAIIEANFPLRLDPTRALNEAPKHR